MSVQTRIDELTRRIEEDYGPGVLFYAAVHCNGCGVNVSAPSTEQLALRLEGWRLGPYGADSDYCPRCS